MKKIKTKKGLLLLIFIISILFSVACSNSPVQQDENGDKKGNKSEKVVLNLNFAGPPGSFQDVGSQAFKQELEALTDGEITVNLHASGKLGGVRESVEMMGFGQLDMAVATAGGLSSWTNEFSALSMPFLFDNLEHGTAVFEGEIGQELTDKFEQDSGVKILGYWNNGFKHISNSSKPINSPADLAGLRIRVEENHIQIDTMNALGANATPLAYTETAPALQQGVVHGQSSHLQALDLVYSDFQPYVTLTYTEYSVTPIMISAQIFNQLSTEHQEAVIQAAKEAGPVANAEFEKQEAASKKSLEEKGIQIIEDVDLAPFKEATEQVYEKWASTFEGDLIERIRNYQY